MKNLEVEDVLDLGWIFIGNSIDMWFKLEGTFDMDTWTACKINMHYHNRESNFQKYRMYIEAIDPKNMKDTTPIFQGVIKTKEEMETLMKQLGILNTTNNEYTK